MTLRFPMMMGGSMRRAAYEISEPFAASCLARFGRRMSAGLFSSSKAPEDPKGRARDLAGLSQTRIATRAAWLLPA